MLRPAHWKYDDYVKAKAAMQALIACKVREALRGLYDDKSVNSHNFRTKILAQLRTTEEE